MDRRDCRDDATGSFGASLAALVGSSLYAAVISWHMRRELHYSLSTAAWTGALVLLFVPLASHPRHPRHPRTNKGTRAGAT